MKNFAAKVASFFVISTFIFSLATRNVSAATVVSDATPNGWVFDVNSSDGLGKFVTGPVGQPLGTGSARLFTGTNGNQPTAIHRSSFTGTQLVNVTKVEYSTYSQSSGSTASLYPMIVLNIDTGTSQIGGDILTFDPHDQTSQVAQLNVWQNWQNAQNGVWQSANSNFGGGTISQYLSYVSNFGSVNNVLLANRGVDLESLRIQTASAGSLDVLDQNVDNFIIGISNADTTYDFEPTVATNVFGGTYFSDPNFTNQVATGTPTINGRHFNPQIGMGSPAPGVPVDNFSARYQGTFNFETAKYRFAISTDNNMKVYIDDVLVIEKTTKGAQQAIYNATAGIHTVRIDYSHGTGVSLALMTFYKTNQCFDMTGDNRVNVVDLQQIAQRNGQVGLNLPWDITENGQVSVADLQQAAAKNGVLCPYI